MKRFLLFVCLVMATACSSGDGGPTCADDAVEICSNGVDDNCDGFADCDDDSCAAECGECVAQGEEVCSSGEDEDCDGLIDCADDDCAQACAPAEVYAAPIILSAVPGSEEAVSKIGLIHNLGSTDLEIESIELNPSGAPFELSFPDSSDAAASSDSTNPPTKIKANDSIFIRVTFTPTEATEQAKIVVTSSAPKFEIPVIADASGPCLNVVSAVADFGNVTVDETGYAEVVVENCGDVDALQIKTVKTCDGSGDTCEASDIFDAIAPLGPPTLLPHDRRTYVVSFTPSRLGATIGRITFDAVDVTAEASLRGVGVDGECPTAAVATATIETTPQTTVELDGTASDGAATYHWSVIDAPFGANTFVEEGETSDLHVNLAGSYTVELRVTNADGVSSCGDRALVTVEAYPEARFYVETFWDTPRDPNQTDDDGTDLDLHFLHPGGAWDQVPWDVYWRNEAPDWGEPGPDDDPVLSMTDDDGYGPEVVTLNQPESNVSYSIGVYSFDDNDHGGSFVTTRIFVAGEEKFQQRRQWLMPGEFWYVAQIAYPSNQILIEDRVSEGFPIR